MHVAEAAAVVAAVAVAVAAVVPDDRLRVADVVRFGIPAVAVRLHVVGLHTAVVRVRGDQPTMVPCAMHHQEDALPPDDTAGKAL